MLENSSVCPRVTTPEKIILFVLAMFPVVSLNYYFFGTDAVLYKNSILNIFIYIAVSFLIYMAYTKADRPLRRISAIGATLISSMLVFGNSIYKTNTLSLIFGSPQAFAESIILFSGFFILLYYTLQLVLYYTRSFKIKTPEVNEWKLFGSSKASLVFIWGVIFLCWLPCYLAYYPGIYSYDIVGQTYQALGYSAFDRFQTTAHTFFFKICIDIGSLFGGPKIQLVTYAIIQMLIISFVFSFVVYYMAKLKIHYGLRVFTLLYFTLNPLNAIFSFVATKDVLFTAFFMLATLLFIDVARDTDKFFHSYFKPIVLCLVLVLACMFRNNAVYAFILFFIWFMFKFKNNMRKIAVLFVTFLISFVLITGPIYTALGVEGGNMKEALSVPMQQIVNVVVNREEELSQTERDTIAEILNYDEAKQKFNPRYADPVKDDFNTAMFLENPSKYAKLWFSLLLRYPADYIEAFLSLNLGYWYADCEHPDSFTKRDYIETNIRENIKIFDIERESVFPNLLNTYESFASGILMQNIPVISLFFSISFPIWFLFLCTLILYAKRRKKLLIVLMPAFFIWLTFMAGPVSNLRYIYNIMACYPIYASIVLQSDIFTDDEHVDIMQYKTPDVGED